MELPVARENGVTFERDSALLDAKWMIDERGMAIIYYARSESNVQRDKYNSLKRKTDVTGITVYAYPVTFNPIDDQLRKAGLKEEVDVLIYTAMKDWSLNDIIPIDDIDHTRDSIVLMGKSYIIKEVGFANHFSDTFLNVTFGLALR